jgi:hypothetical protein
MDKEQSMIATQQAEMIESEEGLSNVSTMTLTSEPGEQLPVVDKFERSKLIKTELGRAVAKFNFKPKKGIKYLADNAYLS